MNEEAQNPMPANNEAQELAPAYAFGATDLVEDEVVRAAMAHSAEVGEEVQAYRRLYSAMHYSAPPVEPRPEVEVKLRASLQPPVAPIAQPYTGPGSQAAQTPQPAQTPPAQIPPPAAPNTKLPNESERIGYWPSTALPGAVSMSGAAQAKAGSANPFASGARTNPLTGKPMTTTKQAGVAPQPGPSTAYVPPTYAQQTAYVPPQMAYAPPVQGQGRRTLPRPVVAGQPRVAGASMPTRSIAIPADFVALPEGQKHVRRRAGAPKWAGWVATLVAVALLVATNLIWYEQQQQQSAAILQTTQQIAQMRTELNASEERATSLQQNANASATQVATLSTTVESMEAENAVLATQLAEAQDALAAIEVTAPTASVADEMVALSPTTLDALMQGALNDATLAPINPASTMTATARIVWNPEMQTGMLMATGMPTLEEGQAYQVWLLRGGVPTSAGMFTIDERGMGMLEMSDMAFDDYEVAAITVEPMNGSTTPTGTILIAGEL